MADTLLSGLTVALSLALVAFALFAARKTKRVKELDAELVRLMKEKDSVVEKYTEEMRRLQDQKALISFIGDKVDVVDRKVGELETLPEKIDRLAELWASSLQSRRRVVPKMTFDKVVDEIAKCKKSLKIATPMFPVDSALAKAILHVKRTIPVQVLSQENGSALTALRKEGVEVAIADGADMSAIILDAQKVISAETAVGKEMVADPDFAVVTDKARVAKTAQAFDSLWDMAQKL